MKEMKVEIPADCEVDKIETQDGHIVVTFKKKERELPKSWEEFCENYYIPFAFRPKCDLFDNRRITTQVNIPCVMADFTDDPEFSDALVALIKLVLLRNCYNGDWVPDWSNKNEDKHVIVPFRAKMCESIRYTWGQILFFKTEELRDEFLKYFRPLIEELKPLYGIKEGGCDE